MAYTENAHLLSRGLNGRPIPTDKSPASWHFKGDRLAPISVTLISAQGPLALAMWGVCIWPAAGEVETELLPQWEAVVGLRTDYVYRGMELAGGLADLQLEGEIILADFLVLNTGGWFAAATGDGFTETAIFADLRAEMNEFYTLGLSVTYHDYDESPVRDGFDIGTFMTMYHTEETDVTMGLYRDLGAEAWYAKLEAGWTLLLSDDASFRLLNGISWTDDYYGRSGGNDIYGRASLTYILRPDMLLTPYAGWSIEIDDDGDGDAFFGGLWLEILF